MSKDDMERAQATADRDWWAARTPHHWKLIGFTERHHALMQTAAGRDVQVDGELVDALHGNNL